MLWLERGAPAGRFRLPPAACPPARATHTPRQPHDGSASGARLAERLSKFPWLAGGARRRRREGGEPARLGRIGARAPARSRRRAPKPARRWAAGSRRRATGAAELSICLCCLSCAGGPALVPAPAGGGAAAPGVARRRPAPQRPARTHVHRRRRWPTRRDGASANPSWLMKAPRPARTHKRRRMVHVSWHRRWWRRRRVMRAAVIPPLGTRRSVGGWRRWGGWGRRRRRHGRRCRRRRCCRRLGRGTEWKGAHSLVVSRRAVVPRRARSLRPRAPSLLSPPCVVVVLAPPLSRSRLSSLSLSLPLD